MIGLKTANNIKVDTNTQTNRIGAFIIKTSKYPLPYIKDNQSGFKARSTIALTNAVAKRSLLGVMLLFWRINENKKPFKNAEIEKPRLNENPPLFKNIPKISPARVTKPAYIGEKT